MLLLCVAAGTETTANNIKFLKDIAHCLCYFKRNKNDGFTSLFSEYIVFY
jgi:hypothetical protein